MAEVAPGNQKIRPFQQRVNEQITRGESVVLQAPTGSGKTRAALEPFVLNLARGRGADTNMPRTCRYAVPMRVLASQFYREFSNLKQRIDQKGYADLTRTYKELKVDFVAQQTGEQPDDPQLEAGLTFCTIDQLLAAFLGLPYSVSPRYTNLKVGGVLGSYLVLDEWHLYPLRALSGADNRSDIMGARATSLAMLQLIAKESLGQFVLMTATFSTSLLTGLADLLGAQLETLRQGAHAGETEDEAFAREVGEIASGRVRTLHRSGTPMEDSVEEIVAGHTGSTLVVCNQVQRAQMMYLRLRDACRAHNMATRVLLIHSRFTSQRRASLSEELETQIGVEAWKASANSAPAPDVIVVATQVVEVGLNISATRLHTDVAPASSLIQRAGRCARFAGQQGEVVVHPFAADATPGSYLPYRIDLCTATLEALSDRPELFDFPREQQLIDRVHTAEDEQFLRAYDKNKTDLKERIFTGWSTPARDDLAHAAAELIRDVQQVPVLIHDDPQQAIMREPWRWQSFSLHPGTLISRFGRLQDLREERGSDWVVKKVEFLREGGDDADSRAPLACRWVDIAAPEQLRTALMVALPSQLAYYDDELGFTLHDSQRMPGLPPLSGWQSGERPKPSSTQRNSWTIERQSYGEHIAGLLKAYSWSLADELRWAATRLAPHLNLTPQDVDSAVRLIIALHDLGKLTDGWQRWAVAWQTLLAQHDPTYTPASPGVLLAKTDFSYARHSGHHDLEREVRPRRPHHAVEGAALSQRLLAQAMTVLAPRDKEINYAVLKALVTAIARHHTTDALTYGPAQLAPGASDTIRQALQHAGCDSGWADALPGATRTSTATRTTGSPPGGANSVVPIVRISSGGYDQAAVWLYFLVVRPLRLADQRADMFRLKEPS